MYKLTNEICSNPEDYLSRYILFIQFIVPNVIFSTVTLQKNDRNGTGTEELQLKN